MCTSPARRRRGVLAPGRTRRRFRVGHNRYVARVSAESTAATGHPIDLALDTAKLHIFDAASGANITA